MPPDKKPTYLRASFYSPDSRANTPDADEYPDETHTGPTVQVPSHERRRKRIVVKKPNGERLDMTIRKHARALVMFEDGTKKLVLVPDSTAERVSPQMVNPQKRNGIIRREAALDRNFLPLDLQNHS